MTGFAKQDRDSTEWAEARLAIHVLRLVFDTAALRPHFANTP